MDPRRGDPDRPRFVAPFEQLIHNVHPVGDRWSWRCGVVFSRLDPGWVDGACRYDHVVDSHEQLVTEATAHLARWHGMTVQSGSGRRVDWAPYFGVDWSRYFLRTGAAAAASMLPPAEPAPTPDAPWFRVTAQLDAHHLRVLPPAAPSSATAGAILATDCGLAVHDSDVHGPPRAGQGLCRVCALGSHWSARPSYPAISANGHDGRADIPHRFDDEHPEVR